MYRLKLYTDTLASWYDKESAEQRVLSGIQDQIHSILLEYGDSVDIPPLLHAISKQNDDNKR